MAIDQGNSLQLLPGALSLADLRAIRARDGGLTLTLTPSAWPVVDRGARAVQQVLTQGQPVYGVNTGFGRLASERIASDDLARLQLNLIRSHCVGVGDPLAPGVVRLILATKAAALARGHSGVRREVIASLLAVFNSGLTPFIPSQGSVGASGDLAPLAHLCLCLMGEGACLVDGRAEPSGPLLAQAGIAPLNLAAKEGLAFINGTQVSTALALDAFFRFEPVLASALVVGALSLDAARGSDGPFDPRVHHLRGHPGQIDVAAICRRLLEGSGIRASHREGDDRVQDPYCLRCQPQVVGACLDQLRYCAAVLHRESNAVTDNPLLFQDHDAPVFLSGGNFHAEPVALAADAMATAIAEVGAIAERRIAMLIDAGVSRLPPFLCARPGLNSGFMIAHVTAAALASENKSLAHPASVDSLPTSANQEDHVSMATFAARRLGPMVTNVARIVAIEWLASAQGIEFLRPLQSSAPLERAHALLRSGVPAMPEDRLLAPDIELASNWVQDGTLAVVLHELRGLPALF